MAKRTRTRTVEVDTTSLYKATLKVLGQTVEATGNTAIESIKNLSPRNCKGRGILIVEKDGLKKEQILTPNQVSSLFNTIGLRKEVAFKNINMLFTNL